MKFLYEMLYNNGAIKYGGIPNGRIVFLSSLALRLA